MKAYLTVSPLGVLAVNEKKEIILVKKLKGDINQVTDKFISFLEKRTLTELNNALEELLDMGYREINIEEREPVKVKEEIKGVIKYSIPNKAGLLFRRYFTALSVEKFGFRNKKEARRRIREVSIRVTVYGIKKDRSRKDLSIIQAIHVLDDLEKMLNSLFLRIKEWYSLYFPELFDILESQELIIKLISKFKKPEKINPQTLKEEFNLPSEIINKIASSINETVGAKLQERDSEVIEELIQEWLSLKKCYDAVRGYIEEEMPKVAPNTSSLTGALIAARLISSAGGLESLAKLPSSTIQLLGAEKALFRFIRGKGTPPKHGVIYQYPLIRKSNKKVRGKLARKLANKIAIAARIDMFSGGRGEGKLQEKFVREIKNIVKEERNESNKQQI